MLYRATTPKQVLIFDVDPSQFKEILITYAQNNRIILEKKKEDCAFEQKDNSYIAFYRLTQEETKLFQAGGSSPVTLQVRVLTGDDEVLASDKKTIRVLDVLNDEVLT